MGRRGSADSYLNVPAVISAAEIADVDAIHPGYGLLSENANFAEVCRASNIKFIGPPPEVTRLMGEKYKARQAMKKAKVPILPGSDGVIASEEEALEWAKKVGYPGDPESRRPAAAGAACGLCAPRRSCRICYHAAHHRGGERVRQRRALHGEVHRAAAAYRVPGAGRRARQCGARCSSANARFSGGIRS